MVLEAIDCQGFAGGFTMGTVQAGWKLIGKREQVGGFGLPNCEANRALLGSAWDAQACEPHEWEARSVDVVFGNPPCSAFSLATSQSFRGASSPINACMHALVEYAARCDPQVVVFESVQQAYVSGLELMRELRAKLERQTGAEWGLYHVLHNAIAVGGAAQRKRYFWLASRVPFGVEVPDLKRVPVLNEVIGDLATLPQTWNPQPYRRPPTWFSKRQRSPSELTDGHAGRKSDSSWQRVQALLPDVLPWNPREGEGDLARRYYELHGRLPESWNGVGERTIAKNFELGWHQIGRWDGKRLARVIAGGSLGSVVHPTELRRLTHREAARILGFPDDWVILPLRQVRGADAFWGKGISVQCGRWIAEWITNSIEGNPGSIHGEPSGEREWTINVTNVANKLAREAERRALEEAAA